jgi:ribosomal protein S18 acetylase RimI-like enzyme
MGQVKLSNTDLERIAHLHQDELPKSLLAAFGPQFLKEFYQALDTDPDAFILVERSAGDILGFITGGTSMVGVKNHFKRNLLYTIWLMRYSFFKPQLILRLIISVKRSLHKGRTSKRSVFDAELYSLVVIASSQRKGVASKLYEQLCHVFDKLGVDGFEIIVGSDLTNAQSFYKSRGAKKVRVIQQGFGKRSFVYAHTLQSRCVEKLSPENK